MSSPARDPSGGGGVAPGRRMISISEGRAPVPVQVGSTYQIRFPPPAGYTPAMGEAAVAAIRTAVAPNRVRALWRPSAEVMEVQIEVVHGGHLYSTNVLRNRVIGAVVAAVAGQTVIPPPAYTFDPNTNTWTLAPLDIPQQPVSFLTQWGGILAVCGILAAGVFFMSRDRSRRGGRRRA